MWEFPGDPADYIEGPPGSGQWWVLLDADTGEVFGPLAIRAGWTPLDIHSKHANPQRLVLKSIIVARLIAADKIGDAKAALDADPAAFARWFASDRPGINHDDPDALALLKAIGADPEAILAP